MRRIAHALAILAGVLAVSLFNTAARADSIATAFPLGSVQQGTVSFPYVHVPLPPGQWAVTALNETRNNLNNVTASITMASIVNGRFRGMVAISTNIDPNANGWQLSKFCARKDLYFMQSDTNFQKEQSCWGINHHIVAATSSYRPTYGKNIRQVLAEHGIDMPSVMINTTFHFASESAFLTYEIALNPVAFGLPADQRTSWADSPWHRDLIARDTQRQAFLDQVKARYAPLYPTLAAQFR